MDEEVGEEGARCIAFDQSKGFLIEDYLSKYLFNQDSLYLLKEIETFPIDSI